jgi:hypothetical protein
MKVTKNRVCSGTKIQAMEIKAPTGSAIRLNCGRGGLWSQLNVSGAFGSCPLMKVGKQIRQFLGAFE